MSKEKKKFELKEEELEKATGGDVQSANCVGYEDTDFKCKKCERKFSSAEERDLHEAQCGFNIESFNPFTC